MAGRNEKKNITKSKIVNYIINNKITSKAELAQNLSLSMPTVLSNVNELIDRNMVIEIGEYESTGGRKAKRIGINPAYKYAVGVVITANHLGIVLLNMQYEIEKKLHWYEGRNLKPALSFMDLIKHCENFQQKHLIA